MKLPVGWFVFIRDEMLNDAINSMRVELRLVQAGYPILLLFPWTTRLDVAVFGR
jgi:hypothetical protein